MLQLMFWNKEILQEDIVTSFLVRSEKAMD